METLESPRPVRRGHDACHLAFRQTLDFLRVTDETLSKLSPEVRAFPSQETILVRGLNRIAATAPGMGQRAPDYVLFAEGDGPELTGRLYALGPGGYTSTGAPIRFRVEEAVALSRGQDTVAISNAGEDGGSLEEYQKLFLPQVRRRIGVPIRNFISYRVKGDRPAAIMAYNYPMGADRYSSQVLSALAVTIGSLGTLAVHVEEVEGAFLYLVGALARASEINDEITGNHLIRVSLCTEALARAAGLSADEAWALAYSSQLHDVGKIHTPREILRKPGPLDPEEGRIMREHTLAGEQIIGASPRLVAARRIAGGHHENWDGSGYPRGLAGEAIPFEARLVKIVDVYDALRSERPYKAAYSHEEALEVLTRGDGRTDPAKHFDPKLLGLFRELHGEFRRIHSEVSADWTSGSAQQDRPSETLASSDRPDPGERAPVLDRGPSPDDASVEEFSPLLTRARLRLPASGEGSDFAPPPPVDPVRLIEELRIHQIELEMQNEELQRARSQLEAERRRYEELYESAPVGYLTLDDSAVVLEANLTASRLLGIPRHRLLGLRLDALLASDSLSVFHLHLASVFKEARSLACQVRFEPRSGRHFVGRLESVAAQGVQQCRSVLSEVGGLVRAEGAVRAEDLAV